MRDWLRKHSLSLVLVSIFVAMTGFTLWTGWSLFVQESKTHGDPIEVMPFLTWWGHEYVLSNLADVFGAILLVLLTKNFREKGSAESK